MGNTTQFLKPLNAYNYIGPFNLQNVEAYKKYIPLHRQGPIRTHKLANQKIPIANVNSETGGGLDGETQTLSQGRFDKVVGTLAVNEDLKLVRGNLAK